MNCQQQADLIQDELRELEQQIIGRGIDAIEQMRRDQQEREEGTDNEQEGA